MNRFLNSISSIILSNFTRLQHPYKLTFAVTYHCNSRCTICSIWQKPHKKELSLIEIQQFFKKNTTFSWINLTGGEILLRNDLIPIINTIIKTQKKLLFLNFPTNGLLTEKIVKNVQEIIRLNPSHFIVSVSLDGPEKLHDRLRGIQGNWKRAVRTYQQLKDLRSSHFDCYFGMTISAYNYTAIEQTYIDLKKWIPDLKRSDIHFNIVHQSSHYYGNEEKNLSLNEAMINKITAYNKKKKFAWTKIALIERIYQNLISKYIQTKKTPLSCMALSSSVFLDPYGNIYPCTMWSYPLGNIRNYNMDLKHMWNRDSTTYALAQIRKKNCSNCWTPCEAYQTILGNLPKAMTSIFIKS